MQRNRKKRKETKENERAPIEPTAIEKEACTTYNAMR